MTRPAIEIRRLRVSRGGRPIIDGVDLEVAPGERVAISGPSGSGKSTLVRAMSTLIPADSGEILLAGTDSRSIPPPAFRVRVAYVPQLPPMFDGTVAHNIGLGPTLRGKTIIPARIHALLVAVGLGEAHAAREARTLSGGERQRAALARALANEPEVLLLDEPTSALDPATGDQIVALIRTLSEAGRAIVMVTHVVEHAAALEGRRFLCEAGKLTAVGGA